MDRCRIIGESLRGALIALGIGLGAFALVRTYLPPPVAAFEADPSSPASLGYSFAPLSVKLTAEAWDAGADALESGASQAEAARVRDAALPRNQAGALPRWATGRHADLLADAPDPRSVEERRVRAARWRAFGQGLRSFAYRHAPASALNTDPKSPGGR